MCMCASMFVCTCIFAPNNQVNLIYLQLILHFCACMQLLCIEIYIEIYYVYDMYIIVLHTYVRRYVMSESRSDWGVFVVSRNVIKSQHLWLASHALPA